MAEIEIAAPGGGILKIQGDELMPGVETTTPPIRTAEEERWYKEGRETDAKAGVLFSMALVAARYQGRGGYAEKLPRLQDGSFNHGAIARSVMRWVSKTLDPDSGSESRELTLKQVVDLYAEGKLVAESLPADALLLNGRPLKFVCIDHALLAAALFRRLGYHAQEVNVVVGIYQTNKHPHGTVETRPLWTYQSAAIRVWYDGTWNYLDPFLETTNVNDTIRATVTSSSALLSGVTGIKSHEELTQMPFRVYVAKGPIQDFRLSGSLVRGMSLRGRWRSLRDGWYDVRKKSLGWFETKVYIPGVTDQEEGAQEGH